MERVVEIVKQESQTFGDKDRIIIFVNYIPDGELLSEHTGIPFYHGKLDDAQRQKIYEDWITGKCPVLAATSAFSTGNDWSWVKVVIFFGGPIGMTDCIQGGGRAGRDGLHAKNYIVPNKSPYHPDIPEGSPDHQGKWAMYHFLNTFGSRRCLRYGFTLYNDGQGTKCRDHPSAQLCSVCK
ncbi:P-loop containing nucleoside triphosphate hydrolase protein, partial [Leucogyrophana mollusca]